MMLKYRIITWLVVIYGAITGARCECDPAQIQAPELSETTINSLANFSRSTSFMTNRGDSMTIRYQEMNVRSGEVDDCRRNYGACRCFSGSSASSFGKISAGGRQISVRGSSELFQEFDVLGTQNSWLNIGSASIRTEGEWQLSNFADLEYFGSISQDSVQFDSIYLWTSLDSFNLQEPFDFDSLFIHPNHGLVGLSTRSDSLNYWVVR